MKMILTGQMKKLLDNGAKSAASEGGIDHKPVIKLFNPVGAATWLISEVDPTDPDRAFGLCDLGMDSPELGYVSLSEIFGVRLRFGLKIERDMHFTANKTLGEYAKEARAAGRIVY
jgi:hypothetical protein